MNRKDRRAKVKKGITHKDLKQLERDALSEGINHTVYAMLAATALALHDKWGWGQKRVNRLFTQINETYDSMEKDLISLEDIKQMVQEAVKIELK